MYSAARLAVIARPTGINQSL